MNWQLSVVILSLLVVSGCLGVSTLEKLPQPTMIAGSGFAQELARKYHAFAKAELERYDWWSAEHFAGKGLAALNGTAPAAEEVAAWDIPGYAVDELRSAHATLRSKLTEAYKAAHPKKAATLQFSFDCWLEEQEEAWETAAIDRCKQNFYRQLDETDRPIARGGPLSTSYLLYLPWDSERLEGAAMDELRDIAAQLSEFKANYQLVINGHADRSGGSEYNLELSQQRANYIKRILTQRGVPASRIRYFAFGESDPEVQTPDGVREPANRRVEIFIE